MSANPPANFSDPIAPKIVRAALLIIGDEILSGRTQDVNLRTLAEFLRPLGVGLAEARVVADDHGAIVTALNALRAAYDYVFTTGGIGPTHDDITIDAVADAFGLGVAEHPAALAILEAHYPPGELTPARRRMARTPMGAGLIANPVSKAPGVAIGNVFVLAGVPRVMRAMLEDVAHRIEGGAVTQSVEWRAMGAMEGKIAAPLAALAGEFPMLSLGSYPFYQDGAFGVSLVARGTDPAALSRASARLEALFRAAGLAPEML